MKKSLVLFFVGAAVAASSLADSIDFGTVAGSNGTVSYAGGSAALIGSGIDVQSITGVGTPLKNGLGNALTCTLCTLSFTTGAETSGLSWGAGVLGSITVTGEVTSLGISSITTLFSGTVTSASISCNGTCVALTNFTNTVNGTLASYFGETGGLAQWLGNDSQSLGTVNFGAGNSFTDSTLASGDLTTTPAPVPEPTSVLLLASCVLATCGVLRKRLNSRL